MKTVSVFFLIVSAVMVNTWAAEDKGTIGAGVFVGCQDNQGNVIIIPKNLKGAERERAVAEFRKCVKNDIERSTNSEIGTAMLLLETGGGSLDGGVDSSRAVDTVILKEGYTTYRNALDEVTAERQKNRKKKVSPADVGVKKPKSK